MQHNNLILEEPIRLGSILEPSPYKKNIPSLTKIVATVGGTSRTVEALAGLLDAGMTAARFDFSSGDVDYHQETFDNLTTAMRETKKMCSIIFDMVGPEITIPNKSGKPISLTAGSKLRLCASAAAPLSSETLPLGFNGLAKAASVGDEIFLGQYLFTGSETTSVWLNVDSIEGEDMVCAVKNSATITGSLLTVHATKIKLERPTFSDQDKDNMRRWAVRNRPDIISVSFTRSPDEIREVKEFARSFSELLETHIYAKIENLEGLSSLDAILAEADGIILGRGNLGLDLPAEKVFLIQKVVAEKCNLAGKPLVISRVVDTMTDTPRPTRAEATDVANAVLDGVDAIMLGAETLRGLYPVETVTTVRKICAEAEKVFNQPEYFRRMVGYVGEPMSDLEAICSSAVKAAEKVGASSIIVFTSSGRAARYTAKYMPSMPVLVVVIPKLRQNALKWSFSGSALVRQCMVNRGLFPIIAGPDALKSAHGSTNETLLKTAIDRGQELNVIRPHDRVVVVQKLKESLLVKIVEL